MASPWVSHLTRFRAAPTTGKVASIYEVRQIAHVPFAVDRCFLSGWG